MGLAKEFLMVEPSMLAEVLVSTTESTSFQVASPETELPISNEPMPLKVGLFKVTTALLDWPKSQGARVPQMYLPDQAAVSAALFLRSR